MRLSLFKLCLCVSVSLCLIFNSLTRRVLLLGLLKLLGLATVDGGERGDSLEAVFEACGRRAHAPCVTRGEARERFGVEVRVALLGGDARVGGRLGERVEEVERGLRRDGFDALATSLNASSARVCL